MISQRLEDIFKEKKMKKFEDILEQDGVLVYKTKGVSMLPMLHQNRDLVVIVKPTGRLKKYDVALYRRAKAYVLHRVIEVKENYYLIRGDNTYFLEKVPDEAVIGVLHRSVRKGKEYSVEDPGYQRYVRIWDRAFPVRKYAVIVWRKVKRVLRKMGFRRFWIKRK